MVFMYVQQTFMR